MQRVYVCLFAILLLVMAIAGCSDRSSPLTPSDATSGEPMAFAPVMSGGSPQSIPDQYIVVFRPTVTDVDQIVAELAQQRGFVARNRYKYALKGFAAKLTAAQVDALRNDPRIEYIEQDQIATIVTTQSNATWGLDRTDQRALPLDATYTYSQNGAGVDVYILDTGIRQAHVDFGGRAVTGYDAITPGGTADDAHGHGTHVAGTVGGTTYGMAKSVRLIAVRVLDANGSGSYSQVIAGIDWATGNHTTNAAVANMSLGGPVSTSLDNAVRNSIADGITYCVAAGNSSTNVSTQSPADVAEAVTVGASDRYDRFASFSNFGSGVDILAPGVSITSDYYSSNTATATMSGTSMASPHVAGAAALYLAAHPGSSPSQVQSGLVASATGNVVTGVPSGTVNRLLYEENVTTTVNPPAAPTLASPADGATSVAVPATLSWNAVTGATSYAVQVSRAADFSTVDFNPSGLTSTSATFSGLTAGTTYYWRVNATNADGTSGWSAARSFTTATAAGTAPAAPTLISPANGSPNVSRTATLQWNVSAGATSYRVQVSTSSSFSTLVSDQSGLTGTSATVGGLGGHVYYYWRVSATNANGTSGWSTVWQFRTRR